MCKIMKFLVVSPNLAAITTVDLVSDPLTDIDELSVQIRRHDSILVSKLVWFFKEFYF